MLLLQENVSVDDVSQKHKTLNVLKKLVKRSKEELPVKEATLESPPQKKTRLEIEESSESEDSGVEENNIVDNNIKTGT